MIEKSKKYINNKKLIKLLEEKRKFGLKKYKDKSFQASFKSSMTSPVVEHAKEELIDEINYLLHLILINNIEEKDNTQVIEGLKKIIEVYDMLSHI